MAPRDLPESRPALADYVATSDLVALIQRARDEDLGSPPRDITSAALVPADAAARATCRARAAGRLSGAALLPLVVEAYDPQVRVTSVLNDGDALESGAVIAHVEGSLRSILALERVALNVMTHLAGIATLTARFVEAVRGAPAAIYDTRKTHLGLRPLEKYAVACGGGRNHRSGLHDAVLVKDNHIAHIPLEHLAEQLQAALARARTADPPPAFIEVEVDTLEQLQRVLACDVDVVLLDNMGPEQLRQAVALRDERAPRVALEASGGVNLQTVRRIADAGVDRIAVGALTHSAPALDIGLDIVP